jgi:hypothetical protein
MVAPTEHKNRGSSLFNKKGQSRNETKAQYVATNRKAGR